jgi:CBS domain-containing protein
MTVDPEASVEDAMRLLVEHHIDAAPVVDGGGTLLGVLSNGDLIVQESRLHYPTLLTFLGGTIELGHKRFNEELQAALAAKVSDVMNRKPVTCGDTDTIEDAATLMHDRDVNEVVVVRDGKLAGIVSRNDVLRAMLAE